ncbi:hypothetical protein ACLBWZ_05900 [Brucellaceae bacterium C25G]
MAKPKDRCGYELRSIYLNKTTTRIFQTYAIKLHKTFVAFKNKEPVSFSDTAASAYAQACIITPFFCYASPTLYIECAENNLHRVQK